MGTSLTKRWMLLLVMVALWALGGGHSLAQSYPDKPVRLVVAYPPGGGADIVARLLATQLNKDLGWQVIVENRSGAAGLIGTDSVARAPADGYTLIMGTNATHAIFQSLYPQLPYDPVADFAPVTNVVAVTSVLVVNPSSVPARNIRDLIAYAKEKPGQLNYASGGSGSNAHLAMELLNMMAGIKTVHVPYKGIAPAVTDLLSGHVQMMISNMPPVLPHIKSGRLLALGMADARRSAILPDLPTIAEAGVAGFQADVWWGVLAPAGTPRPIIDRLNTEIRKILDKPEMKEQFTNIGAEPAGSTPEQFAATIKADIKKWAEVVKVSGAKPN
jgi:tripartite-type tricarboxylate transporter receptor subunit TctC